MSYYNVCKELARYICALARAGVDTTPEQSRVIGQSNAKLNSHLVSSSKYLFKIFTVHDFT